MEKDKNITWNIAEGNTGIWTTLRQQIHMDYYTQNHNSIMLIFENLLDDVIPICKNQDKDDIDSINNQIEKLRNIINNNENNNEFWTIVREIRVKIYSLMHKYQIYHQVEIVNSLPAVAQR